MKKGMHFICRNWYWFFCGGLLALQALVFLIFRENSYIAVHDNMDLFVAHLQILKNTDTFFAQDAVLPMLGGVSRDTFGSEFSLYNILYYLLPNFWAYMTGYALKIAIGIFSFILLAKDVYGEKYAQYRPLVWVIAIAFSLIPVFPAYGIAFTSVPLIVWLLRRIYCKTDECEKTAGKVVKRLLLYLGVFLYPLVSYFSYFGFFILAYIVCAVIILWIRDKRFPKGIALSCVVLALGYMVFEYRLFKEMLFGDTVTIRSTMVETNYNLIDNIKSIFNVFCQTIFHAQDSHFYWVLPVCIIGLVVINIGYVRRGEGKKIVTDSCNLTFFFLIFNAVIYGSYNWEAFRKLIFTLVPPLTGFQFNRTLYFNTFLWYALLFLIVKRLYDTQKKKLRYLANIIVMAAALVVMFMPQMYNDFYHTCYYHAYSIIKQKEVNDLNYREYYSEELFDKIKEDIGYDWEWSAAYGMNPAILQYNGIATLDGYLGLYEQEYKDAFRKVIAPALETAEGNRAYFDDWGARAYLYSGSDENTYAPYKELGLEDERLMIDVDAYKELGGKYIFSRVRICNQEELGLDLKGTYQDTSSPYTIYLYEVP